MGVLRVRGGMTAGVHISFSRPKKRYFLSFSTQVTEKLLQLGFKSATVFGEPGRIKVQFSRSPSGKVSKIWFSKNRAVIELSPSFVSLVFPCWTESVRFSLNFRKGSVSLRGSEAFIVFPQFSFLASEKLEKVIENLEKKELLGEALFYSNFRYRYGYLKFDSSITKWLKEKNVKGAKVLISREGLIFILERDCVVSCRECSRIDCLPFHILSSSFWQAKISIYRLLKEYIPQENLRNLPSSERKCKVFLTSSPGILLIEFPFLKGGK